MMGQYRRQSKGIKVGKQGRSQRKPLGSAIDCILRGAFVEPEGNRCGPRGSSDASHTASRSSVTTRSVEASLERQRFSLVLVEQNYQRKPLGSAIDCIPRGAFVEPEGNTSQSASFVDPDEIAAPARTHKQRQQRQHQQQKHDTRRPWQGSDRRR